jgi:hypothetical protein
VDACQTIRNYPGIFERARLSMMKCVEVRIESHGGHFAHCFSYNSQIKRFRTRADVDIFLVLYVELESKACPHLSVTPCIKAGIRFGLYQEEVQLNIRPCIEAILYLTVLEITVLPCILEVPGSYLILTRLLVI